MALKGSLKILALIVGLLLVAVVFIGWLDTRANPDRVAFMLNIPALPESVKVLECYSPFIPTDLVLVCSIEVNQDDFSSLLRGFSFTQSSTSGTSYSITFDEVGPEFPVSYQFIARPEKFEHGGQVTLLADKEMRRVLIDYYEE